MDAHAYDPDAPSPDDLSFVLIGNPTLKYGGSSATLGGAVMPSDTPYKVLDIAQQYDLIGDFPQNPFNLLALPNAVAGFVFLHPDYTDVDVDDPHNTAWTEGNTTYVFVPTENLPLLEPLRMQGLGLLADALNDPLKALVEQGYDRDLPVTAGAAAPEITSARIDSEMFASAVSDPTMASQDAMVPLSLDPAPISTGPEKADGTGTGLPVADTLTTTPPSDPAHVPDTVKTITPHAAQPGLDNAIAAKQSTTAPTAPSINVERAGNKVEPGQLGGKHTKASEGLAGVAKSVQEKLSASISRITDGLKGAGDAKTGEAGTGDTD